MQDLEFSSLLGKTLTSVEKVGDDELVFTADDGKVFKLHHEQDCCEGVSIESITGDLADLVGTPILKAEEATNSESHPEGYDAENEHGYEPDSFTWTFYKLATIKGYVDIRWLGTSNGYYSESVTFSEVAA